MHSGDFVRDFALIMVAAAAALVMFRLIKQPAILGYLLAGVLVGPFALHGRFVSDTETVSLVAEVGLVVLLFAIGVEFGWERIRKVGFRVVVIGAIEITTMIALGYFIGRALGWTPTTAIYLGSALAFSSSAVLVGMLRTNGQLMSLRGQLVVGVLVVEDFAAVVLLAVFAGYASQDSAETVQVWPIVMKMAVFAVGALVFGTLLAPRLMDSIGGSESREILLIGSLGICFGVGLLAREMGLSAGAGAFLIGTVLGDTKHRDRVTRLITPVRDLFAALFFVSIGMLVNMAEVPEYFVSALIVTGVLLVGKVFAAMVGTFLTGHDGETALRVGTAMPQPGEFSLAIARSGSEHAAVGAQLYPVVTISTLMSSFIYPLVFGSSRHISLFVGKFLPDIVKNQASLLSSSIASARRAMAPPKTTPYSLVIGFRKAGVSFGIIGLLIVAGVLVFNVGTSLAIEFGIPENLVAAAVLAAIVTMVIPAGIVIWQVLADLGSNAIRRLFTRFNLVARFRFIDALVMVFTGLIMVFSGAWMVTQLLQIMPVDNLTSPIPALIMALSVALTATLAMKIHSQMDRTFRRTVLGDSQLISDGKRGESGASID
ncbi:MAG: cation:proton antiporter [SAR202 cluster bacterium]|nr:cation:proton antiporter [SAR202 cluster bacterium]